MCVITNYLHKSCKPIAAMSTYGPFNVPRQQIFLVILTKNLNMSFFLKNRSTQCIKLNTKSQFEYSTDTKKAVKHIMAPQKFLDIFYITLGFIKHFQFDPS